MRLRYFIRLSFLFALSVLTGCTGSYSTSNSTASTSSLSSSLASDLHRQLVLGGMSAQQAALVAASAQSGGSVSTKSEDSVSSYGTTSPLITVGPGFASGAVAALNLVSMGDANDTSKNRDLATISAALTQVFQSNALNAGLSMSTQQSLYQSLAQTIIVASVNSGGVSASGSATSSLNVTQQMVSTLGRAGTSSADLVSLSSSVCSGAVAAIGNLTLTNAQNSMIAQNAASGAIIGLASLPNLTSAQIANVTQGICNGTVAAVGGVAATADLNSYVSQISSSATAAIANFTALSDSQKASVAGAVTQGATAGLSGISSLTTDLVSSLGQSITQSAASSLGSAGITEVSTATQAILEGTENGLLAAGLDSGTATSCAAGLESSADAGLVSAGLGVGVDTSNLLNGFVPSCPNSTCKVKSPTATATPSVSSLWVPKNVTTGAWRAVTFGNSIFVALSAGPTSLSATSSDGVNWSTHSMSSSQNWAAIAFGNGKFVAVAGDGSNVVATSSDGVNWSQTTMPSSANWTSITFANGIFLAISGSAASNGNFAAQSTDGIHWTEVALPIALWTSVTYGNGLFVAVSYGPLITYSADGVNWSVTTLTSEVAAESWASVTFGNGIFVAVPDASQAVNAVPLTIISQDGINWTWGDELPQNHWSTVAFGNNTFVAGSSSGGNSAISTNGLNWTVLPMPSTDPWSSIAFGNQTFVGVSAESTGADARFATLNLPFKAVSPNAALSARSQEAACWTGNDVIFYGGFFVEPNGSTQVGGLNTGAIYNAASDTWRTMSNGPEAIYNHTAVCSGTQAFIWGGQGGPNTYPAEVVTGVLIYNEPSDSWTKILASGEPEPRQLHTSVWTGSAMIVWGGASIYGNTVYNDGGIFNPSTNTWTALSMTNAPSPRYRHSAIWSGTEMIIFGGQEIGGAPATTSYAYNPTTNAWRLYSMPNNVVRSTAVAATSDGSIYVIGGQEMDLNSVGAWTTYVGGSNPNASIINVGTGVAQNHISLPGFPIDVGQTFQTAVWIGNAWLLWGIDPANSADTAWRDGLIFQLPASTN